MNIEEVFLKKQDRCFLSGTQYLIWVLCFISLPSFGQTSPLYSNFFTYEQFINPAITGRDKSPVINLSHKLYMIGMEGSPSATCLGGSMRLGSFDFYNPHMMINKTKLISRGRMGFGAMLIHEKDGPLSSYFGEFTYAYFVPFNHNYSELSFGLSAQFSSFNINKSILEPADKDDPEFLNLSNSGVIPEGGCGIYYHDLQFYAGASINDLFLAKRPYNRNNSVPNKWDYFFQTGYKFFLKYLEMEPSLYVAQIDDKPFFYYSQLKFYYQNTNWLVIGYKSVKSVLVSLGLSINRYHVAYAYEQNISDMGNYFRGSHEIMVGINIGLYEPQGIRKRAGNAF
jgi:type IX secretion system PorP/SprF family membrane protein